MWRTGAFAGQFGDPYLENTELEGGKVHATTDALLRILDDLQAPTQGEEHFCGSRLRRRRFLLPSDCTERRTLCFLQ